MRISSKFCSFSGIQQLWKFDGKVLKNKAGSRKWKFTTKDELIYINNDSIDKVVGTGNTGRVIEEEIQEGKLEQLWKIGEADTEGYFTLENSKVPKLLTFISPCSLRIEGKFQIDCKYLSIYFSIYHFLLTDPYNGNAVLAHYGEK